MNLAMVYDVEGTGIPDYKQPSDAEHQPHIVQLAAALVDLDHKPLGHNSIIQSMDVIVRPEGWTIPEDVTEIHGISDEYAREVGIPESLAVETLLEIWQDRPRIAHNENYDQRMVRCALKRSMDDTKADEWKAGEKTCTAELSRTLVSLPPTEAMKAKNMNMAKTPTLDEACRHFYGQGVTNAHTAMGDLLACLDLYAAIQRHEAETA